MRKKIIFEVALFLGVNLQAHSVPLEIPDENVVIPKRIALAKFKLTYDKGDFYLKTGNTTFQIKRHDIRDIPSKVTEKEIQNFLKVGYFTIGKIGEDHFLQANFRLRGGVRLGNQVQGNPDRNDMTSPGGIIGGTIGTGIGYWIGTTIGGPIGGTVGGVIGNALTMGGYALGNAPSNGPSTSVPKQVGGGNGGGGGKGW